MLLGCILFSFTHCVVPFQPQTVLTYEYGSGSQDSYAAFSTTLHPILRANCIECHEHRSTHAHPDPILAHDNIIAQNKVDFINISNSYLVGKIPGHYCSNCNNELALEVQDAIAAWSDAINDPGDPPPPISQNGILTSETRPLLTELEDPNTPRASQTIDVPLANSTLVGPMEMGLDLFGEYIWVPNNGNPTRANNFVDAGVAKLRINVPEEFANSGYKIWARASAADSNSNAFWLKLSRLDNSSNIFNYFQWNFGNNLPPTWYQPNINSFSLLEGDHEFEVREREDGSKLYRLILTSDTRFEGSNIEDFLESKTLEFDLGNKINVPGTIFKIDVREYDEYSYKFLNPRIVVPPGQRLRVKSLKPLINGSWSFQNSTYLLVDKVIDENDGSLSQYSMIALKDQGIEIDKISFLFETLESTISGGSSTGGGSGGNANSSVMAFENSVWPLSRNNCVSCHTTRFPKHANEFPVVAHDDLLNGGYINFNNPSNSSLVIKIMGGHNCGTPTQCNNLANEYIQEIIYWRDNR